MMEFGYGASAAAQLPPEIETDCFLLQAGQAVESGDNSAARAAMEKILALPVEHGIEPAPEDHFPPSSGNGRPPTSTPPRRGRGDTP